MISVTFPLASRLKNECLYQIQTSKGETVITNDGATILKSIQALHPAAKMACLKLLHSSRPSYVVTACRSFCCSGY